MQKAYDLTSSGFHIKNTRQEWWEERVESKETDRNEERENKPISRNISGKFLAYSVEVPKVPSGWDGGLQILFSVRFSLIKRNNIRPFCFGINCAILRWENQKVIMPYSDILYCVFVYLDDAENKLLQKWDIDQITLEINVTITIFY